MKNTNSILARIKPYRSTLSRRHRLERRKFACAKVSSGIFCTQPRCCRQECVNYLNYSTRAVQTLCTVRKQKLSWIWKICWLCKKTNLISVHIAEIKICSKILYFKLKIQRILVQFTSLSSLLSPSPSSPLSLSLSLSLSLKQRLPGSWNCFVSTILRNQRLLPRNWQLT